MEKNATTPMGFVQRRLPWIIAAGVLVIYLLTLPSGITFAGLPAITKVLGWDWQPVFGAPLHFILTFPVRWLPTSWQIPMLNVFAVGCSVLALVLLARSVAILPHDRTRDQRALERSEYSFLSVRAAWLPPVLAVLACGLSRSYWENTVVATGEALDLLLFAYCVRCLLEYRVAQKQSWLSRLAFVYGLAVTNNHAMIAFFPAFLVATVWILGRQFFKFSSLIRLTGFGLLGLSLYLLAPVFYSASGLTDDSFLIILRTYVAYQVRTIIDFPRIFVLITGLTSILPILFIGIRWPAEYGDISAAGNFLANITMHIVHGLFLAACLVVMFDPAFSPRVLGARYGQLWAFLPMYFLAALTVGYCSGYFLLVFGSGLVRPWHKPSVLEKLLDRTVVALVWIALVAVPAGLLYRNFPVMRLEGKPFLRQFGEAALRCLPPQGAVVLSDDPYRLYSLHGALYKNHATDKFVLIDTTALPQVAYHRYLSRTHDGLPRLPEALHKSIRLDAPTVVQFVRDLVNTRDVYYLHPSFGYYFEHFRLIPHNLVYQVKPCPAETAANPLPTAEQFQENIVYWRNLQTTELGSLIEAGRSLSGRKVESFGVELATYMFSRPLNFLGTELQKAGRLPEAGEFFRLALALNTNNPAAYINLDYNTLLLAGKRDNPRPSAGAGMRLVSYYNDLQRIMNLGGPFDEPNMCQVLSRTFISSRNYRQAAQQLERVAFYNPGNFEARITLASLYNTLRLSDLALETVAALRTDPLMQTNVAAFPLALIEAEALAFANKDDLTSADQILRAAQKKYPQQPEPFLVHARIYLTRNDLTNAMAVMERQVQIQTNNANAWNDLGVVKMNARDLPSAIVCFERALALFPQNQHALANRAIASLQLGRLEVAQRDYELLLKLTEKPPPWLYYGLGEVSYRIKDAAKALRYYELFLKAAPPLSPEIRQVQERVSLLKSGKF